MLAVDTNVLVYARDPRDEAKQATAIELIETLEPGALPWQVACEYLAATRKLEPLGFPPEQAWKDVQDFRRAWTTILPAWETFDLSRELLDRYSLSFWDALLAAACIQGGVERLYTEDFDAYPKIEGIEVVNPF